jgi:phenylacetate-CoA ligase
MLEVPMTDAALFVPSASLPGIAWPAVPAGDTAAGLAILDQLERSQWWPLALLRRQQFHQLAALLAHARATVPFYRDRLAGLVAGEVPSEVAWRRIPILTRREIQEAGVALDSTAVPPEHGAAVTVKTSGSTGTPVAVKRTQMSTLFWQAITLRDHFWHRRDLGARLAIIRMEDAGRAEPPDGLAMPSWGLPTAAFFATGPGALLTAAAPLAAQAEWLERQRADYLLALPTNLLFLARHCHEHASKLRFRGIATIGSPVGPELRALCSATFGAAVTDIYSTIEAGYLALQCPTGPHYHIQSEDVLVEILDEAGNDCAPGQTGRVVVTPLHEYSTPLIRYAIGDYAVSGPPCRCGRGLPVIAQILGRTRNMLRLQSGELRFPGFSLYRLSELPPVIQAQAVQTAPSRIEVRLAVRRPLTAREEATARALLGAALGGEFEIAISTCDEIPRAANGKFEEFRSEIGNRWP